MQRILILALLIAPLQLFAQFQVNSVDIKWSAYKTAEKKAVGGSFDRVNLSSSMTSSKVEALKNSSVVIDKTSVNSGHEARDKKLSDFYFDLFSGKRIYAKIVQADDSAVLMQLKMNNFTKNIVMKPTWEANDVILKGTLEMLDFKLGSALKSINKACYELHKGKTWSDVAIEAKIKFN